MTSKLNDVYRQMLDEISKIFSFSKNVIDEYDNDLDFYKMFIKNTILHLEDISLGNAVNLCNNNFYITEGIKFKEIWDDKLCDNEIKNTIWKYLHSMIFIICSDELHEYVESEFKDHKKFDKMCENAKNVEKILDNLKNYKDKQTSDEQPTGLEGTAIGSLAKEIMDDIGMSGDIDPSKPPSIGDLGSLMSKTFSAIQSKMSSGEFDESKMMAEASQMMGGMNLFGQGNSGPSMPRGMSGMPMNKMNVNKRKIVRTKKKNNKKK